MVSSPGSKRGTGHQVSILDPVQLSHDRYSPYDHFRVLTCQQENLKPTNLAVVEYLKSTILGAETIQQRCLPVTRPKLKGQEIKMKPPCCNAKGQEKSFKHHRAVLPKGRKPAGNDLTHN